MMCDMILDYIFFWHSYVILDIQISMVNSFFLGTVKQMLKVNSLVNQIINQLLFEIQIVLLKLKFVKTWNSRIPEILEEEAEKWW